MWSKGKVKSFRFEVPMIWREPRNHSDDCYFCSCNIQGYSLKNKKEIFYPNLESALRPVPHGPDIPIPLPPERLDDVPAPSGSESGDNSDDDFQVDDCSESHLSYFPENLGAVSEEQGERFHQDTKEMERRYQGRCNVNMIADYCWMLHRERPQAVHKRKRSKRSFEWKKKRHYKDF